MTATESRVALKAKPWSGWATMRHLKINGLAQRKKNQLCNWCWQQAHCPREFAYPASAHEILFGLLPQATPLAKHLLEKVRPWVEPAQSYDKNQLGLRRFFLNSLHLTWIMTLLADAVVLLRAHALLSQPRPIAPLGELTPKQLSFSWN
jgi:hypothetical protein